LAPGRNNQQATGEHCPLAKADNVLLQNVMNGFQSSGSPMAMPPKGGNPALNEADIKAVLKYMRKTFGK